MIPVDYPIEAFAGLWQMMCCISTVIAVAFTFLFAPR
jgi:hypothetical protein